MRGLFDVFNSCLPMLNWLLTGWLRSKKRNNLNSSLIILVKFKGKILNITSWILVIYFLEDLDFWDAKSDLADLVLTVEGACLVAPEGGLDELEATGEPVALPS